MVDEKPSNPVGNREKKPKNQFDKKSPYSVGDWGGKPEDWWRCAIYR